MPRGTGATGERAHPVLTRRALLAGLGGLALASPRVHARETGVLTAADVHVDGYPTVEAVRFISRALEQATGGALRVRLYHAGQLGRESDTINLARFGALDFTRVHVGALNNMFPATRVLALPYVFDSVAHMRRAHDGAPGRAVLDAFAARGLVGLAIYDAGARCFYNARRAIATPADLRGLKIRVPPSDIFMELVRAFGANPTPLAFGETYSALETGLIDGAENNWLTYQTSRQFEAARHWAQSEHSYAPDILLMSATRFASLTPQQRETLKAAAAESVPYMRGLWDQREDKARAEVLAAGTRVTEVEREAFRRAARPVLERHLRDTDLAALHREIQALSG